MTYVEPLHHNEAHYEIKSSPRKLIKSDLYEALSFQDVHII